ncbi:retinoblastoma binding protein 4 [Moniliophthora roreri]|nr:retinoblastoma binding protein 4 [Moniliophthora roreri]
MLIIPNEAWKSFSGVKQALSTERGHSYQTVQLRIRCLPFQVHCTLGNIGIVLRQPSWRGKNGNDDPLRGPPSSLLTIAFKGPRPERSFPVSLPSNR